MLRSVLQLVAAVPFIGLLVFAVGLALAPAHWAFLQLNSLGGDLSQWATYVRWGLSVGTSYYVYGFSLILVVPFLNFVLQARLRPWRGPAVSFGCWRWYVHNTLVIAVRYTFLELITPTEFSLIYFRLMGMKLGRGVTINSSAIADPSLITMEDYVTIGGSAGIMAHYAQSGYMIIAPVVIKKGATIGLRAVLLGGVEVGEKAKVLANSYVLPNTKIPAGETWAGTPAVKVDLP